MNPGWFSTFPLLLLLCSVSSSRAKLQQFENSAIVRTVELAGSVVHVTTTYAIKALGDNVDTYTIAFDADEADKSSWVEVRLKGEKDLLEIQPDEKSGQDVYSLLHVKLPKPVPLNNTINLVVDTIQTRVSHPWPEKASQKEEQGMRYSTGLFIISPYSTAVQRLKLKSPTPQIHSYSAPVNIQAFTLEDPVSKSGATVTYGPYRNIPPSADQKFLDSHQQKVSVHYNYDQPVLEVLKLKRAAEVSHWGANLNIQDVIDLHNAGPELKGHFSRLEHQAQKYHRRSAPHILPSLTLHLPAGIRDVYYYDQIGNVSTSRLRTAPSVPRLAPSNQYSVLELRPRYPLLGGWNYSFTLGWDAPLADSTGYDPSTGKYLVEIPILTPIPGAVIKQAELKIILPEGATDISYVLPFHPQGDLVYTYKTYLDTQGRPAVQFDYVDLTPRHARSIYVWYRVPLTAHLRKPFAVGVVIFGSFLFATIARRINLSLHKQKQQ